MNSSKDKFDPKLLKDSNLMVTKSSFENLNGSYLS